MGGNVTLTCNVKYSADTEYDWFRQSSPENKFTGRVISIYAGGIYTCRGYIKGTNSLIAESEPVIIPETGELFIYLFIHSCFKKLNCNQTTWNEEIIFENYN